MSSGSRPNEARGLHAAVKIVYPWQFVMTQSRLNSVAEKYPELGLFSGLPYAGRVLCLVFAAIFPALPAMAETTEDVFTVSRVEVDATADTATTARDQALAAGHKAALERLFKRIVVTTDQARLPTLDAAAIAELVRDFEVVREKASPVRYLASLKIRFKRERIRELLRGQGIGFAETTSRPVLVLPVFEVAGAFSLWGQPNPWREAWAALPRSDGLVPLIGPKGDLKDVALIGAEQAVRGDDSRLAAIAKRYGAAEVLVTVAGFRMGAAAPEGEGARPFLQVSISRLGRTRYEQTRLGSFSLREGEDRKSVIMRAASAMARRVQEKWKSDNRLRFDAGDQLTATIPITSLGDWLDIKRRLAKVVFIRQSNLVYLSRKKVQLSLNYIGDTDQLTLALAQNDLVLERGPISWLIRRGGPDNSVPADSGAARNEGSMESGEHADAPQKGAAGKR